MYVFLGNTRALVAEHWSLRTASEWNEEWEDWGDMDPGGGTKPEGGDNSTATHSSSSPQPETSWLAECYIAASPTSDLMALGFKNRLAILSRELRH